jgi:cobalt-zinc-cadmium efflux system protein
MSCDHHSSARYNRAFALGIGLNLGFVVVEAGGGLLSGSMALLSDAGHNFSDVLALVLAWAAFRLAASRPTQRRTYGLKRATVLASLSSAVLLCVALGAVIWESIERLGQPNPVSTLAVIVIAGIGLVINAATALLFMRNRRSDLNIKGAFLHMAGDAVISLGVVIAGIIMALTGWSWLDPLLALIIAVVILISGVSLLRESLDLAMDAVPRHIDPQAVKTYLGTLPGVTDVHDLHIWGMSTTETALTAHLVMTGQAGDNAFLQTVADGLHTRFAIHHPTLQIENGGGQHTCTASGIHCSLS